jgi:predicted N-acyltransferase
MTVKISCTIKDIDKAQWDELAKNHVMSNYGWLKTIEETFVVKTVPQIFTILDSKGIVGACACYIFYAGNVFANLDHVIFGKYHKLAQQLKLSFLPALVCSQPYSYGSHFLLRKDLDSEQRRATTKELFLAIEETASKQNLPVAFINTTVEEAQLDGLLQTNGYQKALDMPLCYLDICWDSFNDYLTHFKVISKNSFKTIKGEINRNIKKGVLIHQLEDCGACEDRIHELINLNIHAYNNLPFMFSKAFYKKLKENLGNDATIYTAVKEGRITGVSIRLSKDGVDSVPIVGVDHEISGNDFTYFNITFYRPIMDAISSGKARINYGRGMYELKRRRGCKVENIYFYYKPYSFKQKLMAKWLLPLRSIQIKKIIPANIKESLSRKTRMGHNPKTGEKIKIKGRNVVTFKPSKNLP